MKKTYSVLSKYFRHIIKSITNEDYFGISAEVSYMMTMGIFPLMLFLTAVFGLIGKKFLVTKIIHFISFMTPSDVTNLIKIFLREIMSSKNDGFVAIIGFFVTLFLASNVISSIIKALNKANGVKERRSFLQVRLLSLVIVFVNTFFLLLSFNLIVLGNVIIDFLSRHVYFLQGSENILSFLRWPLAFALLFIFAAFNYYVLPSVDFSSKRKSVIPGSLFFCIMWLFGSWLFSLYVDSFGTYNKVYGSIAGVAIMMVWLQYTAMIIIIGGEINNLNLES